jgi:hypothetical protein
MINFENMSKKQANGFVDGSIQYPVCNRWGKLFPSIATEEIGIPCTITPLWEKVSQIASKDQNHGT